MKMDYIVSRIGAPTFTFSNPNDFKAGADRSPPFNAFGANMIAFTSEDLMNNLPKAMSNIGKAMGGGFPTDSPNFKISMREYEDQ